MVSWINADGLPLKAKLPIPGMGDMLLITTDQKTALTDFVPPEFFMTSVIKADRKIDKASTKRIRYRIRAKDGKTKLGDLPEAGPQRVFDRNVNRKRLREIRSRAQSTRHDLLPIRNDGAVRACDGVDRAAV